ncbi:MAG: LysM peptidoglycan-binding domain-containing protein [Clostridia bacterium]|nr:LysM peptidoglycan-binding domain-containing protein [Clostridia bacterium]
MIIYTVEQGDSLYSIAGRLGTDAELIARDNGIENSDKLVVGQALAVRIPDVVHTVSEGENLYSLAQTYGRTVNELWRRNPHLCGRIGLEAGDRIVISDGKDEGEEPISVNAFVYPSVNRELLTKTLPYLTYLTIFSYGIEEDAELIEIDDEEIIETARRYGVAPIMLVSNIDADGNFSPDTVNALLADKTLEDRLIGNILSAVSKKRYGGAAIDFEYVSAENAEALSSLVSRLNEKLGSGGYPLFVLVAPKREDGEEGLLCEGHDYSVLGNSSDGLMIETYTMRSSYDSPSALLPVREAERILEYAADKVKPRKLFLGMANYGYDWILPYSAGESRAVCVGNADAVKLAGERGADIKYDEEAQSPYFEYYSDDEGVSRKHAVYFQDARCVRASLDTVKKQGVGGIAVWNAMKYSPQLWLTLDGTCRIKRIFD